ncbi:uncharacterized protein [Arachis hypogaea]|uniref:uncharacterized protein n=1 Tax=Arachis hypogaea TaxID=3818 RepID=UPI003B21993B
MDPAGVYFLYPDLWLDLKHMYYHGDRYKVAKLEEEMYAMKQRDLSITNYFTKLKALWEDIDSFNLVSQCKECYEKCNCSLGTMRDYRDETYAVRFLRGLNEQYGSLETDNLFENEAIKRVLDAEFSIKDLGRLKFFLGMEVARNFEGITLYQRRLLYLANTRPDIAFAVGKLSQFLDCATGDHYKAALHVLRYIKKYPSKANSVFHERTKHIEVNCHIVREKSQTGVLNMLPIKSAQQTAYLLTKALSPGIFESLLFKLDMLDIHAPLEGGYYVDDKSFNLREDVGDNIKLASNGSQKKVVTDYG